MVFPKVVSLAPIVLPYTLNTLNLFLTKLESITSVTRNLQMIRNCTRHPNPQNFNA